MTTTPTSTLLASNDPYAILHARVWGRQDKATVFFTQEKINIPSQRDLNTMEQSTYTTLSFGPILRVFPNDRYKMLVRDEYPSLLTHVENDRRTPGRQFSGMVITGHAGIGKRFFLYYYLIRNLIAARPTALQLDKSSFFLFVEQGAHLVRFSSSTPIHDTHMYLKSVGCKKGTVALVLGSEHNPSPAAIFTDDRFPFYVIHSSAVHPSRWKSWVEQRSAKLAVMQPWQWSEIFIGSTKFTKTSPPVSSLLDVFEKYGPSARTCFDLAGDESRTMLYDRKFHRAMSNVSPPANNMEDIGLFDVVENPMFLIVPDQMRLPLTTIISRYVGLIISHKCFTWSFRSLYQHLDANPETRSGALYLYEAEVHHRLRNPTSSSGTYCIPAEKNPKTGFFLPRGFVEQLSMGANPETSKDARYYIIDPSRNNLHIHALIIWDHRHVCLVRATTDPHSPIQLNELDELANRMPETLLPWSSSAPPWKFLFVIPQRIQSEFSTQPFQGKSELGWDTERLVRQYIRTIPDY